MNTHRPDSLVAKSMACDIMVIYFIVSGAPILLLCFLVVCLLITRICLDSLRLAAIYSLLVSV